MSFTWGKCHAELVVRNMSAVDKFLSVGGLLSVEIKTFKGAGESFWAVDLWNRNLDYNYRN